MRPLFSNWRKPTNAALKWAALLIPMAMAVGSACAFFLWSLDAVTHLRFQQPWLLYLLPVAGLVVGLVYHRWGKSAEGGSNLILDEIHRPGGGVPRRVASRPKAAMAEGWVRKKAGSFQTLVSSSSRSSGVGAPVSGKMR